MNKENTEPPGVIRVIGHPTRVHVRYPGFGELTQYAVSGLRWSPAEVSSGTPLGGARVGGAFLPSAGGVLDLTRSNRHNRSEENMIHLAENLHEPIPSRFSKDQRYCGRSRFNGAIVGNGQ